MKNKILFLLLFTFVVCVFGISKIVNAAETTGSYVYEKVTSLDGHQETDHYMIVCEKYNVYFDGSLSTLDAGGNFKSVTITDNTIYLDEDISYFTISSNKQNIQSASGFYIGNTKAGNALYSNKTTKYTNTITFSSGNVLIKGSNTSKTSYIKYYNEKNTANCRFRYYTSTQTDVQLYKLVETPQVEEEKLDPVDFTEVKAVFTKYYNNGVYTKDTVINVDTEVIKEDLTTYFHAGKNPELVKTTYYSGENLWFEDGHGYGTHVEGDNTYLTSINNNGSTIETTHIHSSLPGMEDYYCTLNDFVEGTHTSTHIYNKEDNTVDLTQGWEKNSDGVYYNSSTDVIDAYRLFVAPTWLGKTAENANYVDYTRVSLEENDGKLVMKLWISADNYGYLTSGYEKDGDHIVFATAEISNTSFVSTESASIVFENLGYENAADFASATNGVITVAASIGSNTQNGPKYYNTGKGIRIYVGNTLTVSVESGYAIQKVIITTQSGYTLSEKTSHNAVEVTNLTETEAIFVMNGLTELTITAAATSRIVSVEVLYYSE